MSSPSAAGPSPNAPAETLTPVDPASLEAAWATWTVRTNRRGLMVAAGLILVLHPIFAALDRYVIPPEALPRVWLVRAVSFGLALLALALRDTRLFERHAHAISSGLILSAGWSICVMTREFGGLRSPYASGLLLVMFGAGLIFLWPLRVALANAGLLVAVFAGLNHHELFGAWDSSMAIPLFFVGGTALVVTTGQQYAYRRDRQTVTDRLRIELADAQLREASAQIQERERFKSRFFANMTHELKTPLAMILSPVELLLEEEAGAFSESQRATLRGVYRNGARLLKLIGDLLDLSRIEESRLRLRVDEHDLRDHLGGLCQQCAPLFERKRVALVFAPGDQPARAWIDPDRMERVFVNLLSNAARFTPVEGRVEVGVEADPEAVRVWVQDNGPGFPAEEGLRVFERFYQVGAEAGTPRYDKGGTGIGLALAREIVELHGGTIRAESSPGRGARFEVTLRRGRDHLGPEVLERRTREREVIAERREDPMADFTRDFASREDFRFLEVASATERRVVERDRDEASHPHTVLVVEDTPDVARLVHMTLRGSMRVLVAADGSKGLELARRERPDLVVTDLMMPVMDGLELTRSLRDDPSLRHIPVVMLTARGDLEDRLAGAETGVSAYLAKPFSPRELLATVRAHLRRSDLSLDASMQAQMASLETVSAGLAHEINNPLNYIKQAVVLIARDVDALVPPGAAADDPAQQARARIGRFLDTARAGVARIGGTVGVMQRYAREGYTPTMGPVDLFALARDAAAVVGPATGNADALVLDLPGEGVVSGLADALQQVVTNLVQNALEAAPPEGGRVAVVGRIAEGWVILQVSDNGPGVAAADRARIFRPFFTTKDAGRGMGMGLSIVWRVVRAHGGSIVVGEADGGGALFTLRLRHNPVRAGPPRLHPPAPVE